MERNKLNLFRHAGELYGQPGQSTDTYTVGLCTGLLAAAAVASSPALPALIPLGVEVALVAFRLGHYVGTTARRLDLARSGTASWSTIVTGTTESLVQDVISAFHNDQVSIHRVLLHWSVSNMLHRSFLDPSMRTLVQQATPRLPSVVLRRR